MCQNITWYIMTIKFTKKTYSHDQQKQIINDYQILQSIEKVSIKHNLTTRQIINILNDNNIPHNNKRKVLLDECYFDKNDNKNIGADVMYWAGFIAADGNIINNSKIRNYALRIKLATKDKNHLQKFKKCINTTAKIIDLVCKETINSNKCWKEAFSSYIVLYSKHLVSSLYKYNIVPNKSKIYEFPITLNNHKFINSFIRGYFDGDGSISFKDKRLRINFYGTQNCLNNIAKIINNNCEISLHNSFKNRTIYNLEYNGKEAVILAKWLYKDCNIYLDRKYNLIKEII